MYRWGKGWQKSPKGYNKQCKTIADMFRPIGKNIKDIMIPSSKNITEADADFTVAVIMCIFLSQLMSCLSYDEKSRTRPKMEEKLLQLLHMLTGTKLLRVLMKAIRFCDLWV